MEANIRSNKKLKILIAQFADSRTCQLFVKGGDLEFKPIGTGVFIKLNSFPYVLTAAHIAEFIPEGMYILYENEKLVEIEGCSYRYTNFNDELGVDLAYIRLNKNIEKMVSGNYEFLTSNNIEISHIMSEKEEYFVLGYPEINMKKNKKTYLSTHASGHFLPSSKDKVYEFHNMSKALFYLLDFKGAGIDIRTGKKVKGFYPQYGLSGGGLWHLIKNRVGEKKYNMKIALIGIMTDQLTTKYNCLAGNKIDGLINMIAHLDENEEAQELIKGSSTKYQFIITPSSSP